MKKSRLLLKSSFIRTTKAGIRLSPSFFLYSDSKEGSIVNFSCLKVFSFTGNSFNGINPVLSVGAPTGLNVPLLGGTPHQIDHHMTNNPLQPRPGTYLSDSLF